MARRHRVLCSGAENNGEPVDLHIRRDGKAPSIKFSAAGYHPVRGSTLEPRWLDFLDIAAFVYGADGGIRRGSRTSIGIRGTEHPREIAMTIGVRDLGFWQREQVVRALTDILMQCAGDSFEFEFTDLEPTSGAPTGMHPPTREEQTLLADPCVVLASGGLDSTARIVERAVIERRPVLAVGFDTRSNSLGHRAELLRRLAARAHAAPLLFRSLQLTKVGLDDERTYRTRPLMLVALGAATARVVGATSFELPENAITAINAPLHMSTRGRMASATAHPGTLYFAETLLELVCEGERPIRIVNPLRDLLREDTIEILRAADCLDLLRWTVSCSTGVEDNEGRYAQCGRCSQCLWRRLAVVHAGVEEHDPVREAYAVDPLRGDGSPPEEADVLASACRVVPEWQRERINGRSDRLDGVLLDAAVPEASRTGATATERVATWRALHARAAVGFKEVLASEVAHAWGSAGIRRAKPDSLVALGWRIVAPGPPAQVLPEEAPAAVAFRWRDARWEHGALTADEARELIERATPAHPVIDLRGSRMSAHTPKARSPTREKKGGLAGQLAARLWAGQGASASRVATRLPGKDPGEAALERDHSRIRSALNEIVEGLGEGLRKDGPPNNRTYRFDPSQPCTFVAGPEFRRKDLT